MCVFDSRAVGKNARDSNSSFTCIGSATNRITLRFMKWQCFNLRERKWWHDIKHNDTEHNDIQHNDAQRNDAQHNGTQHNGTFVMLNAFHAECQLC